MNSNASVSLEPLAESNIRTLARTAFAGAAPAEVMPDALGAEWTDDVRSGYFSFLGADSGHTTTYVVYADGTVVGAIRLMKRDATTAEIGMWLSREARGRGNGTAAVREILVAARRAGYRTVVAEVRRENAAALGALNACGAATFPGDEGVSAEIAVPMGTFHDVGEACLFSYATDAPVLTGVDDFLDAVIAATWGAEVDRVVLPAERLAPEFFDLTTKMAGDVLQKMINYRLNVAIVGDFSAYMERSGALRDFVRESNRGHQVWFLADEDELAQRLGHG